MSRAESAGDMAAIRCRVSLKVIMVYKQQNSILEFIIDLLQYNYTILY